MKLPDAISTGNVYAGTLGGTLMSVLGNVLTADIVKTAILAAVGAVVSFCVSVVLRGLNELYRKSKR